MAVDGRDGSGGADRPLPPELDPRSPRAGSSAAGRRPGAPGPAARTGARRWVVGVRVVAAVLSFAVLAGSGYAWASYQHFTSGLTQIDGIPGSSQPGGRDVDGRAQNILLVGDDHRPADASPEELAQLSTGQDGGGTNTDTMMVLHFPGGGGAPTVISFPRDSWVDIPGFGQGKLNSAFTAGAGNGGGDAGGMRLLVQTIQTMTGLTIDHFVRVSMVGFYDIADVLGPIQVCLNQPARDPYSGTDLPAGVSTLDAKQALSFVRQRHGLPRGDLDREVRQQYFLSAELHKVISAGTLLNPVRTQALLGAVSSALETDPGLDLLGLASQFQSLSADQVTFTTIPITGTPTITDAAGNHVSIVSVDTAAMTAFIDGILGTGTWASSPPAAVAADTVTVQVVNGTGRPGLAATNSAALARLGFRTEPPINGASQRTTTITYPAGQQAAAGAVAAHLPGATLAPSNAVAYVTVTLGTDGIEVEQGSSPAPVPSAGNGDAAGASPSAAPQTFTSTSCIN